MKNNIDYKKYKQLQNLQKLQVMDAESTVSDKMLLLSKANRTYNTAKINLHNAEMQFEDITQSSNLSLDMMSIKHNILMQAAKELELSSIHFETAQIAEQDSRLQYHRSEIQLSQISKLHKKVRRNLIRKIDEKKMIDISALLISNQEEEYYES